MTCQRCQGEIVGRRSHAKYCSERCRKAAEAKRLHQRNPHQRRAWSKANYAKHRARIIAYAKAYNARFRTPEIQRDEYWRNHDRERLQSLRRRLKHQFGGAMPPAWLVEARELALLAKWRYSPHQS